MTIFLDLPAASFDAGTAFWCRVTGSRPSSRRGTDGEFATLLPHDGDAYLRVQRIGEGDGGTHLDLHLDPAEQPLADAAGEAVRLGAWIRRQDDDLVVLDSPGGFSFCLTRWDGETRVPTPSDLDDGGLARLDQLCLDIPAAMHDQERAFWAALTGRQLIATDPPEFSYLEREPGMPARLLFQHRAVSEPGDRVRGHLDFAAADIERLAGRHTAAGASELARFPFWITLADPSGRAYCLTRRPVGRRTGPKVPG
jgi:Glyoxalase-like domain